MKRGEVRALEGDVVQICHGQGKGNTFVPLSLIRCIEPYTGNPEWARVFQYDREDDRGPALIPAEAAEPLAKLWALHRAKEVAPRAIQWMPLNGACGAPNAG